MEQVDPVLVRCAACDHNFETRVAGRLTCPICHEGIWLEPSDDLGLSEAIDPPAAEVDEGPASPVDVAGPAQPGSVVEAPAVVDAQAEDGARPSDQHSDQHSDQPEDPAHLGGDEAVGAPKEPSGDLEMETLRRILEAGQRVQERRVDEVVPAWESGEPGLIRRFWATIKQVFQGPPRFFAGLKVDSYYRAFSFGWILCTFGVLFFSLYGLWQLDANYQRNLELLQANPELLASGLDPEQFLQTMRELLIFSLIAAPLIGFVNLWVTAGLYHLGVIIVMGKHRGFKATFRATAYGFVPLILLALPLVGHLIGGIWSLVLQVVAIGQIHRSGSGRATLAVLLPVGAMLLIFLSLF